MALYSRGTELAVEDQANVLGLVEAFRHIATPS